MNKNIKIIMPIICVLFFMFGVCAAVMTAEANKPAAAEDVLSETGHTDTYAEVLAYQEEEAYTVGIFNGRVGVFYGEFKDVPAIETNIDENSLRQADRELLQEGITVENYDEVLCLLEDFNS